MKLLTNMPFEAFEERSRYPDIELVCYGPAERMCIDKMHYPPDVVYDPATEHLDALFQRLPPGFVPDALLIYWPDQEPIPLGLETCPVPVVGVISDYNLSLPWISGLWAWFDIWLCDRAGQQLFRNLSFADTRYWCQYSYKAPSHRIYPEVRRDLDIGFSGNLNPVIQHERLPWLERMLQLNNRGFRAEIRPGVYGADYGRYLNRCKLGFNRAIRGEMNLRAFEVPACGSLLLMEAENLEIRDFFTPDEEVLLYTAENFEDQVAGVLTDPARLKRIARAGQARVRSHSMSHRLAELVELLQKPSPGRPQASTLERQLARGNALLGTWGKNAAAPYLDTCHREHPDDPRVANAYALARLSRQDTSLDQILRILAAARRANPDYIPAAFNLWYLLLSINPQLAARAQLDLRRLLDAQPGWPELDGVLLPADYSAPAVCLSQALGEAVRTLDCRHYTAEIRRQAGLGMPLTSSCHQTSA